MYRVAALCIGIACGAFGFFHKSPTAPSVPMSEPSPLAPHPASASSQTLPRSHAPGFQLDYSYDRVLKVLESPLMPEKQFRFQGILNVQILDSQRIRFQITNDTSDDTSALEIQFKAPFQIFEVATAGSSTEHLDLLKDLVSEWGFFYGVDPISEYDSIITSKSNGVFSKDKVRYRVSRKTQIQIPEILNSHHEWKWSFKLEAPERIQGNETLRYSGGESPLVVERSYLFQWTRTTALSSVSPAPKLVFRPNKITIDEEEKRSDPSFPALQRPWSELESDLAKSSELPSETRLALLGELTQGLKKGAIPPGRLVESLRTSTPSPQGTGLAVGALASAGTPESQRALIDWYQDPSESKQTRELILNAITASDFSTSPEMTSFLIALTREANADPHLSEGAWFALGSSIPRSSGSHLSEIESQIHQAWRSARPESRLILLDVIGNSESAAFMPEVRESLQSNDPRVRQKALFALRAFPGHEPEQILKATLRSGTPQDQRTAQATLELRTNLLSQK